MKKLTRFKKEENLWELCGTIKNSSGNLALHIIGGLNYLIGATLSHNPSFFEAFPDYQNIFEIVTSLNSTVIMQGYSICSDKRLEGRAIWTAKIDDDKVTEWRVYLETEENRIILRLSKK